MQAKTDATNTESVAGLPELMAALPAEVDEPGSSEESRLLEWAQGLSGRGVPIGRLNRLWVFGTLPAKIAAAYVAHWLRSFYSNREASLKSENETRLRAALQMMGTMSYLRGAMAKLGQMLANWPEVVPIDFAQVLGRLNFEAPPMHFALLREQFRNEMGRDPEEIFDDFEPQAFAAASLGQVHRARLKGSGHSVAVKIQYPDMARAIREDFANLMAVIWPMRLSADWDNLKAQFRDIVTTLERETDYELEAEWLRLARLAIRDSDGVVVPRVYAEFSTKRVLTMDYLAGQHLDAFLKTQPSQEVRDSYGEKLLTASFRLWYSARMLYADPSPGNYLFMPDGRLGLIDFGCCRRFTDHEWALMSMVDETFDSDREGLRRVLIRCIDLPEGTLIEPERMRLLEEYTDWSMGPMRHEGVFDFGDEEHFREGVRHLGNSTRKRNIRQIPVNTWITRMVFGIRAVLYHLGARVDMREIYKREFAAGTRTSS